MTTPSLGEQELALLHEIAATGPTTVGEAAERFGAPRGLARSTVLTMMERLRAKSYLKRRLDAGVYRYASRLTTRALSARVIASFVTRSLAGSITPLVSYLAEQDEVSESELGELEALVDKLKTRRREER